MVKRKSVVHRVNPRYAKRFKGYAARSMQIYRPPRLEVKQVDVIVNSLFPAVGVGGAVFLLNGLKQGDDVCTREGRQVFLKGIECWLTIQQPTGTTIASMPQDDLRMLLVCDKSPNGGSAPVISDILRDIDSVGTASTAVTSGYNVNNVARFQIISDKLMHAPAWNIGNTNYHFSFDGVPPNGIPTKSRFPLNKMMRFTGVNALTADISSNALYLVMCSGLGAGGTYWLLTGTIRTYFTDV